MPSKRGFDETDFEQIVPLAKRSRRQSILDYADESKPHHIHLNAGSAKEYNDALTKEFPPLGDGKESLEAGKIKSEPTPIGYKEWMSAIKKKVVARINGRDRSPVFGLDTQYQEVYNLLEHTILEGEGNSCLLMGPRSCGKTLIVDTALDKLKEKYNDQFITIKLSGFSQGDDKMALREICRQFDVELSKDFNEEEYDGLEKKSMSETLQALLDLLDPQPAPLPENEEGEVPEPSPVAVVIILEEFDRFTQLSRQTLLYNLFDLAQSSRTPLAVIGVTSRMNTRELFEKRVRSRFSQRVFTVNRPKTMSQFWGVCKASLELQTSDIGLDPSEQGIAAIDEWNKRIEDLYEQKDSAFFRLFESTFYTTKDVREFYDKLLFAIKNASPLLNDPDVAKYQREQGVSNSQSFILGLSELELSLLICAARVEVKFESETFNFNIVYDEYMEVAQKVKQERMVAMSNIETGPGGGYRIWSRDVARSAWERLESLDLVLYLDAGGGCSGNSHGAGGTSSNSASSGTAGGAATGSGGGDNVKGSNAIRDDLKMAKVDANLLEIASIIGHDHVLRKWTRL